MLEASQPLTPAASSSFACWARRLAAAGASRGPRDPSSAIKRPLRFGLATLLVIWLSLVAATTQPIQHGFYVVLGPRASTPFLIELADLAMLLVDGLLGVHGNKFED